MSSPGDPPANPDDSDGSGAPDRPAKSSRAWLWPAAAVVVLVVAGVVAWLVVPGKSDDSVSGGVTGEAVKQILLDGAELTKLLDQPFKPTGPPIYGGFHEMENPSTAGDCTGVTNVAPQRVYSSADVQSYARETWVDATPGDPDSNRPSAKVMFVAESVVALPSAADAQALFATFAEQWKRCDGQAVDQADVNGPPHLRGTEIHISDVRVTDSVLAASIAMDGRPQAPDARAIGVQGNCLVGILIAFTGVAHATGSGDPATSSIDAVRMMMDKVVKLS